MVKKLSINGWCMKINISTSYYNLHFTFGAPANKSIICHNFVHIECGVTVNRSNRTRNYRWATPWNMVPIWYQEKTGPESLLSIFLLLKVVMFYHLWVMCHDSLNEWGKCIINTLYICKSIFITTDLPKSHLFCILCYNNFKHFFFFFYKNSVIIFFQWFYWKIL